VLRSILKETIKGYWLCTQGFKAQFVNSQALFDFGPGSLPDKVLRRHRGTF